MRYDLTARTAPTLAIARTVGASILAITMMLVIWATSSPAAAQSVCTTRSAVAERLAGDHAEAPVAAGLAASGEVVEVFTSDDGATWTIILTRPGGTSCLVAAGEAWMTLPAKVAAKGPDV
jgi:hypothetical protein